MHTLHTESYEVDKDGNKWERHYLVIPYKSPVKGDVGELHKNEPTYNLNTHKFE